MRAIATVLLAASFAVLLVSSPARAEDTAAPQITYTPPASAPKGPFKVVAKIVDESKFYPQVYFRYGTGPYEKALDMKKVKGSKDQYEATIPYKNDSIDYYLEAYDDFGNGPARAGDPDNPLKIRLGEEALVEAPKPKPAPGGGSSSGSSANSGQGGSSATRSTGRPAPAGATASSSGGGGGRTWTWIVGGTGLGLLTGGLLAGMSVKSADDAYKQALAAHQVNDPSALQAQYDANKSLGTKATLLTAIGLTMVAGGVGLYFLEGSSGGGSNAAPDSRKPGKKDRSDDGGDAIIGQEPAPAGAISVAAVPLEGGGGVAVAGRF